MHWIKKLFWKPTHQHYKGGLYKVLFDRAILENTLQSMVVYQDESGKVWIRTVNDFMEMVPGPNTGLTISRFIKLN